MDSEDLERVRQLMPKYAAFLETAAEKTKRWAEAFEPIWTLAVLLDKQMREEDEILARWEDDGGALAPLGGMW